MSHMRLQGNFGTEISCYLHSLLAVLAHQVTLLALEDMGVPAERPLADLDNDINSNERTETCSDPPTGQSSLTPLSPPLHMRSRMSRKFFSLESEEVYHETWLTLMFT